MFVHLLLAKMTIKVTYTQTHTFVIGALGGPWWKWKWRKYLFLEQPCIDIYSIINEMMVVLQWQSKPLRAISKKEIGLNASDCHLVLFFYLLFIFVFRYWTPFIDTWSEHYCQFFKCCPYEFEFLWLPSGHRFSHAPFKTSYFGSLSCQYVICNF